LLSVVGNEYTSLKAILKSVILSFVSLVLIEVLSTFSNPSNAYVYLLIDTVMNIPRILALGIAIGYLYKKLLLTN
jgi:hypothetical protein